MGIDVGDLLYNTLMGGLQGYNLGHDWESQNKRLKLADEEEKRRALFDQIDASRTGAYQGTPPDETIDVPFVAPGMPAPPTVKVTPDRYRPIGDTGYYQDFTMTPASQNQQNRQSREALARQLGFQRNWDAGTEAITKQNEQSAKVEEQSRVLAALKASGLFSGPELALLTAVPEAAPAAVRGVVGRTNQTRRVGGGSQGPRGETDVQRIAREDRRRSAIVAGDESQMRRLPKDPFSQSVIDTETQDSLQAHADSVRSRVGSEPDNPDDMPAQEGFSPTADLEMEAVQAYKDAVAAGADPELANKRLIEYIQAIRAGQYE